MLSRVFCCSVALLLLMVHDMVAAGVATSAEGMDNMLVCTGGDGGVEDSILRLRLSYGASRLKELILGANDVP